MSAPNPPQLVLLSWTDQGSGGGDSQLLNGSVYADASLSEQHVYTAQATTQQVEKGADITDHVRALPPRVTLEFMITNTPLGAVKTYSDGVLGSVRNIEVQAGGKRFTYQAFQFDSPIDRVREVFGDLVMAVQAVNLFSLVTTLASYEDLACVNFSVPRNQQSGNALRGTMDFSQIQFVETELADALPGKVTQKHRGPKAPKEVPPGEEKHKSFLRAGVQAGGKLLSGGG